MTLDCAWRGAFTSTEVDLLHAEAFGTRVFSDAEWDWRADTMVAADARRSGVGTALVATARRGAEDAGCQWLHVDFQEHLRSFSLDACGFTPTAAGLLQL